MDQYLDALGQEHKRGAGHRLERFKAQSAAVKAVGGGKAAAVTTDVSGNGFEVTVAKSDGSQVEVHLDGSFNLDDHGRLGR